MVAKNIKLFILKMEKQQRSLKIETLQENLLNLTIQKQTLLAKK